VRVRLPHDRAERLARALVAGVPVDARQRDPGNGARRLSARGPGRRREAPPRFQERWAEWQRSSRGIQEALHGISQLTQQAEANYEQTEQGIASSFGR
jgi:hypothetical protein